MAKSKQRFSQSMAFFWMMRLNRTAMVAMITGAGAFTGGAGSVHSLWMTLAGWCLAVGVVCAWLFATRPSPRLAYTLTLIFMMGMGFLICMAMILGSI